MAEWFEDESFWEDLYPFLASDERIEVAKGEVAQIIRLLNVSQGASVLDLCCGPGRHSLILAKKKFQVTGLDRTKCLLNRAKAEAKVQGLEIEWIQQDMRDFVRTESFDLVLSMLTSFGYFDNKDEDKRVLRNVLDSLKPGGSLVLDLAGKEILARIFQPTNSHDLADGSILVERHEIFDDWTRIRNEWILIKGDQAKTHRFHHTIYSGQELRQLLEGVGFGEVRLYGSLEGDEYGLEANRLIAVGQKARTDY
jgi:SAM-dependent methyltransferase